MTVLLDTSVLMWWLHNDDRLGHRSKELLGNTNTQVFVSVLSIHEYDIKARLRKVPPIAGLKKLIESQGFQNIDFTAQEADTIIKVPQLTWKDPFDLALIAQARTLNLAFLTSDKKILKELSDYIICLDARK